MLRKTYARLADPLTAEACRHFGHRLVSLVIFGAIARVTMRPDSDIDGPVVAEALPAGRMARLRKFDDVEHALVADFRC